MIKIANAPCSWGVLEFELEGEELGYAQFLDELKETGYAGTELGDWGFLPSDPEKLSNELHTRSLHLVGAFVPVDFVNAENHQAGIELALKTAELMDQAGFADSFIILADENGKIPERTQNAGRITTGMGRSDDHRQVYADGVGNIASAMKEILNMRSVFHHHCAGYVETPAEIDKLLSLTDPELLGLCLDMGHYRFGGGNPVEAMKRYYDRIWHVHFKDCLITVADQARDKNWNYFESVGQGVFCELGKGDVDFDAIVSILNQNDYDGWITVEQDVLPGMGDPKSCAQRNRDFIKKSGLYG